MSGRQPNKLKRPSDSFPSRSSESKCSNCPRPARPNLLTCQQCADRSNRRHVVLRAARRARGLCQCGAPPVVKRAGCRRCLDRSLKRSQSRRNRRIAVGSCAHPGPCRRKPVQGRRMCRKHLASAAVDQKKRRARMNAARRCVSCGSKLPAGRTSYCLRCHPTKDGKTRLQKRRAREREQESADTQVIKRRIQWNALIETILHDCSDPRAAAILRMRCGINEQYDRTLREVGEHFGITRERVRQIEQAVLGISLVKLRRRNLNEQPVPMNSRSNILVKSAEAGEAPESGVAARSSVEQAVLFSLEPKKRRRNADLTKSMATSGHKPAAP